MNGFDSGFIGLGKEQSFDSLVGGIEIHENDVFRGDVINFDANGDELGAGFEDRLDLGCGQPCRRLCEDQQALLLAFVQALLSASSIGCLSFPVTISSASTVMRTLVICEDQDDQFSPLSLTTFSRRMGDGIDKVGVGLGVVWMEYRWDLDFPR